MNGEIKSRERSYIKGLRRKKIGKKRVPDPSLNNHIRRKKLDIAGNLKNEERESLPGNRDVSSRGRWDSANGSGLRIDYISFPPEIYSEVPRREGERRLERFKAPEKTRKGVS